MQNTDWIELFRLIPADQHNTLVLTTVSGMDINMDIVLRTEENFLVFRGRVSGITDEGRVFFLPYRQIDFLQINRTVKEIEIRQLFGEMIEERVGGNVAATSQQAGLSPSNHPDLAADANARPAVLPLSPSAQGVSGPLRGSSQAGLIRTSISPGLSAQGQTGAGRPNSASPTEVGQSPPSPRQSNVPGAAVVPSGTATSGNSVNDQASPPRNSILERLRAQRNSILPPRPPGR